MKVRVVQTVTINDAYRRAVRRYYGKTGLATRKEICDWIKSFGESMDTDLGIIMDMDDDNND